MNYLNIHTDILRGSEFIGADPVERATWLALLGWCATQENGGVIEGCKNWKDRQWQQLAGVTAEEVKIESELYGFDGDDLEVYFYPIEAEAAVKAKREAGRKGGRPLKQKPENPDEIKEENHMGNHMDKPSGNHMGNHEGNHQRNEKKRKEKKRKDIMSAEADELDKDLLLSLWNTAPEKARRRSSRKQVADAWKKIPKKDRPEKDVAINAMKAWNECEDWTKDDGNFVQGLHLWLKNEKWLDPPKQPQLEMRRILK